MTDPANPARPPLSFEEVTADTYALAFASSCSLTPIRRGVLLRGTCPRCGDEMDFPVITEIFLTTAVAENTSVLTVSEEKPVMCTCRTTHPGQPAGDEGCGAYWNIKLSGPAS
jgi:hypothetical protein